MYPLHVLLILWDFIFSCYGVEFVNKREKEIGTIDFGNELVMTEFLCAAMLINTRKRRNLYLVIQEDPLLIYQKLFQYPITKNLPGLIELTFQCRNFIFSRDIKDKPNLPKLPIKAKTKLSDMFKDTTKKFVNKIKLVNFSKFTNIFEKSKETPVQQVVVLESMENYLKIKTSNEMMKLDAALANTNVVIEQLNQILMKYFFI